MFLVASIFFFGSITTFASGSDFRYVVVTKKEKELVKFQCSIAALEKFVVFKNVIGDLQEDTENSLEIVLDHHTNQANEDIAKMLLLQAKDLAQNILYPVSCNNTIGFIQLAERYDGCDELKNKIAQTAISGDHAYDALYHAALSTDSNIGLIPAAARKWFLRCIDNASDEKKLEIRKKLYPLQYSSATFIALRNKVTTILNEKKYYNIPFDDIPEFKVWQDSLEHQAYCTAKPSYAISCVEFYKIKQKNKLEVGPNQYLNDLGYPPPLNDGVLLICSACGARKTVSWFKDSPNIIACNACTEKELNGKLVDLSDCNSLDMVSLNRIVNRAYYLDNKDDYCSKEISEAHEYLKHLPQIHLPLLELLVHYKNISYCRKHFAYPTNSNIIFGTGILDLHPVDAQGLTLFKGIEYGSQTCTFNINSTHNALPFKSELTKLRKTGYFFILLTAPDAIIEFRKWNGLFNAIFRDDKLFITDIPKTADKLIKYIGALVILYLVAKSYNRQWDNYLIRLNECVTAIPSSVIAMAGYLSNNQRALWGKNIDASLPQEVVIPPFAGGAHTIGLEGITTAMAAINKLQGVQSSYQPTYSWSCLEGFSFGCIGLIGKTFLDWICTKFAKPGMVRSTLQILGFIEPECSNIACYMEIIKPEPS
jgi:hypothetical protein